MMVYIIEDTEAIDILKKQMEAQRKRMLENAMGGNDKVCYDCGEKLDDIALKLGYFVMDNARKINTTFFHGEAW